MKRALIRGILPLVALGALAAPGIAHAQERALEVVSPAESQGNEISTPNNEGSAWGALDGDHAYFLDEFFPLDFKLSTRTPSGWTSQRIGGQFNGDNVSVIDFSPDMATVITLEYSAYAPEPGHPEGFIARQGADAMQIASWDSSLDTALRPVYLAGSEDRNRLVLQAVPGTFPGAASNSGLYRWTAAQGAQPINIDMTRYAGATCTDKPATPSNREDLATLENVGDGMTAVSTDGGTIVATTPSCTKGSPAVAVPSHLVLWHDGASTDITVPVAGGVDGDAAFVGMRRDASRVFFTTTAQLEASDTNGASDLYVWDGGRLTRLTDGGLTANQSQVSRDGSTVWFRVDQPLGGLGEAGKPNIFAWDGERRLVGTFATGNNGLVQRAPLLRSLGSDRVSKLSEHGDFLVYGGKSQPVTGADYTEVQAMRVARDGRVDCLSCPPSGVAAKSVRLSRPPSYDGIERNWTPAISADGGTVAFQTTMALDPRDTNGNDDVYAWIDGRQVLLSSGTDPSRGVLRGMTPDGSSVFFTQGGALAPGVTDTYGKLWVARLGGGFPVIGTPDPCGTACQGPLTPAPALPIAATVAFSGPGNLTAPAATSTKVTVSKPSSTVRGTGALVRVKVPGAGTIRITGSRTGAAKRTVAKGGTYQVRVRLTKKAQRSLAKKSVTASLKVRFTPADGDAASRSVSVRFAKKATSKKKAAR